jgi:putative adhesin
MRKSLLIFAICALAAPSAASAQNRWSDETEHVSRTLPLEPGGTLRLKSFSGRVTITASDRPEVVIDAVRRASRERLNRITLDAHSEGTNLVVVDANHRERSWFMFTGNNVVETDFDIKVPRRTNLDVSVFSASVSVDGVAGSHRLNGFSSRVSLIDLSGPIKAHSFSGSILIRAKTWDARQSIDVDTFSGNIELHVPESARGHVTFNSFSGRLNSEMPLTLHGTGRRSLTAELGGGGGATLSFKTFSGSVRIDR